jgi:hypothetical protein
VPRIDRLAVEKGRTVQVSDSDWRKTTYRLEADVSDVSDPDKLEDLRLKLVFTIDDWLQQEQHTAVTPPEEPDISAIPEIDLAELDACPWQTFQKKPAKAGQAAWIKNPTYWERFDAPPVLWELVKALEGARDRKLVLGDMEYVFGGTGDMKDRFINRKSVKESKAR